jgi:GrpB-like predicted nucleotidyltransferase (UPF0157 family)
MADHYPRLVPDPIVIVEYDLAWPAEFERLRTRVAAAVGGVAVAIEHVGSTAVPGLAAKPVIDVVVVVEPHDLQTAVERLVAIGYVHQGNLGVEAREAFGVPEGEGRHHLYVSPIDSEELRAQLAFRDRLRANPELAAKYEGLKRELAMRFRDDREGYADAKTDFVIAASRP